MKIPGKSIEVKCRNCGRMAPADKFVLDYKLKMVVCPSCIKEVHKKEQVKEEKKPEPKPEPKKPGIRKIESGRLMVRCPKCNYEFKYNPENRTPRSCPYCNEPIKR